MDWVVANVGLIVSLTLDHLRLSVIPVVVGFIAAVPLGWAAVRYPRAGRVLVAAVGSLYTIPSLAMFMVLPPLLGFSVLSETNVIVALAIYATAIMVQSSADAFGSVDPGNLRAATAMGYSEWARFWGVEVPLAGPVLLAGLRVVAVSTVSLVTVGVLVGVPSLGYLFTDGFQRKILAEVVTGVVMTVVVALAIDALLVWLGRVLMPWSMLQQPQKVGA